MTKGTWSAADVRTSFPQIVEAAEKQGPQRIERYGQTVAVLVSPKDWAAHREMAKNAVAEGADDGFEIPSAGRLAVGPADLGGEG